MLLLNFSISSCVRSTSNFPHLVADVGVKLDKNPAVCHIKQLGYRRDGGSDVNIIRHWHVNIFQHNLKQLHHT